MKTIVIGHKNPDLDSVASAIGYAHFKKMIGKSGWEARRAGELDYETAHVLGKFNIPVPGKLESVKGKRVALVDHCTYCQMADGVRDADIVEVIDHHNIGDIQTSKPIKFNTEPVGSTSTIIASYFFRHNIKIPKNIAGLLLAAIISDTDLFKSPTTTQLDLDIKDRLEKITGIDAQKLGIEMFKVKSDLSSKKTKDIVSEDGKEYNIPLGIKIFISQVKVMELDKFLKRREEIKRELKNLLDSKNYELIVFMVTDLINEGSEVFAIGKTGIFEKALNVKLKDGSVFLPGVLSRKKQIVPPLIGVKE